MKKRFLRTFDLIATEDGTQAIGCRVCRTATCNPNHVINLYCEKCAAFHHALMVDINLARHHRRVALRVWLPVAVFTFAMAVWSAMSPHQVWWGALINGGMVGFDVFMVHHNWSRWWLWRRQWRSVNDMQTELEKLGVT